MRWGFDALVRAVARVPLPIRTKQLIGSFVVAGLLALVAALGLVALGQSNSRGAELRRLQRQGSYEQLLLTDATQLRQAILTRLEGADTPVAGPGARRWIFYADDVNIVKEANRLCLDGGFPAKPKTALLTAGKCAYYQPTLYRPQLRLRAVAPALARYLGAFGGPVHDSFGASLPLLWAFGDSAFYRPTDSVARANKWVRSFVTKLVRLTRDTQARADALVASNQRSYGHARDLLIGAGAASLLLALALGVLLSDSFLAPVRATQGRLAAIAAGDFSGRLVVPNRDEIGALAADVNGMSDELQRLYAELEDASRHKSDFLATMSHELRTPLNAIIGFSEVLHGQISGDLNEDQLADVEEVLAASEHLLSLINDVLDLSKIEAGRMELELSPVAVQEILENAVSMHAARASRGGIDLALAAEPDEITVTADERRVRQVVFNLLSNAVKFTPAGGRIDVSARRVDGHVEIAVADTGTGIAQVDLETIFEEFEQTSDGKRVEGTGLGLPVSRKLVELHRGRLWVESEPGRGSTFRFTLPVEYQA